MSGHVLRDFQLAAVLQVRRNSSGAEAVRGNLRLNPSISGPALNHGVKVGLGQGSAAGELPAPERREQGRVRLLGQAGRIQPFI